MKVIMNLIKKIFKFFFSIKTSTNLSYANFVHRFLSLAFLDYYESFLLVILCKYDLGLIRFGIAKWFFCGLLLLSTMEIGYCYLHLVENFQILCLNFLDTGYVDVMDIFTSFFNNFWSIKEPALPKDLHVLTYKTVESVNAVENVKAVESVETVKSAETVEDCELVKRPYCVYVCAFLVLYWGFCVVGSGA